MKYDQKVYEKLRSSQSKIYDKIVEKVVAKGLADEAVNKWKQVLTESEYVTVLVSQYIGICSVNGICEFMEGREDDADFRFALMKMGSVGKRECDRMNAARDFNRRVVEALINESSEDTFEKLDKEREVKIGGISSFDLQIALDDYLKLR